MCLARSCVPDIDMPNLIYCANDDYFVVEFTACQTGTIGNLFINDNITLIESQQIQIGSSPNTYYFSIPFTTPGTYSITFCIYSTISNVNEYCETFTVTILPLPTIEIAEGENITICPGNYNFHDISSDATNGDVEWTLYYYYPGIGWDSFIPEYDAPNSQYSHLFTNLGSYYLVATVTTICGADSDIIYIEVVSPSAEFTWTNACLGSSVCFSELSNCEEYWHWNFGDGSTSDEQNPCHEYAQAGNYLVTLEVAPGLTVSHTITVYSPVQPIITGDEYACETSSHYQVTPAGAFSQIGWAVNSPSGWVATAPPDEYNYSWANGTGGVVYVETTDNNGCFARTEMMVFDCCFNSESSDNMYYNEPFVFPTSGIFNEDFYFNGEIVFTTGSSYTFTYCHFYMGENAKVTVQNGAHVDIGKSGIIEACSGFMWDGFYVENGGDLIIHGSNINQPVYVRDAKNAVYSLNGGKFLLNAVVMDKNFKHLVVDPYSGIHSGTVKHTVMTCSGTLLPQYPPVIAFRTQDAITVNSVGSIAIGEKNAGNTISNCDIGILSMNSFIRVVGNTFSNIEPPTSLAIGQPSHPRGYGILTASLDLTGTNPYGLSTMPATLSMQGGNTFTNVTYGIYSFNNGQINIRNNTLKYPNNPYAHGTAITLAEISHPTQFKLVTTNTIENYNKGILVGSTTNSRISGNTIKDVKNISTSFFSTRGMGIRIEGGSNNVVQGNTVQNTGFASNNWNLEGVSASLTINSIVTCNTLKNMGKSILYSGNCFPAQVKKNTMQNGIAGFTLSNGGFTGTQGGTGTPWDNEWKSNFSYHLFSADANTNGSLSPWYIGNSSQFTHPIPFISGGASNIPPIFTSGFLFQLCAIPVSSVAMTYSTTMDDIANNMIPELQYPDYQKWMSHHGLMKNLKTDSLLLQYPALSSFEQQQMTLSTGKILQIEDTLLSNDISVAALLVGQLQTETLPDSIRKEMLHIGISASLSGIDDWTMAISSNQWDKIKTIASLCPFIYGEDVYLSRIMLKIIGDTTYYFNECEEISEPFSNKSLQMQPENENVISVFPNPASDFVTVETEFSFPATIDFYSPVGQLLKSVEISNPSTVIDISGFEEGLILYKIRNEEEKIQIGYLNIIR